METKRVKVFEYIRKEREPTEDNKLKYWHEREEVYFALFLGWGVDYEELESGAATFTAAIVQKSDGSVGLIHPSLIQFIG